MEVQQLHDLILAAVRQGSLLLEGCDVEALPEIAFNFRIGPQVVRCHPNPAPGLAGKQGWLVSCCRNFKHHNALAINDILMELKMQPWCQHSYQPTRKILVSLLGD